MDIYGGFGDDTWLVTAYGDVEDAVKNMSEYHFGEEGNDYIHGSHKATGDQYIYGGDGHDRLVGGDGITGDYQQIAGNDGDDIIYGGNNIMGD